MGSLGRQTLDYAGMEHGYRKAWRPLCNAHKWAVRILTLPLPLLAMAMLTVGVTILPVSLDWRLQTLIVGITVGVLAATVVGYRVFKHDEGSGFGTWSLLLGLSFALPVIAGAILVEEIRPPLPSFLVDAVPALARRAERGVPYVLALEWSLLGGALLYFFCKAFDRYRPGALKAGLLTYAAALLLALWFLRFPPLPLGDPVSGSSRIVSACLWTIEVIFVANGLLWLTLGVLVVVGWVLGGRAVRQASGRAEGKERTQRAVRTARLTLTVPAIAFLLVTMILWSAVVDLTRPFLPALSHAPLLGHVHEGADVHHLLHDLLWRSVPLGIPPAVLLLAGGFLVAAWWLVPLALAEVRPPREDDRQLTARHGRLVSRGMAHATRAVAWVTVVFAVLYVGSVVRASGDLFRHEREPLSATEEEARSHSLEWLGRLMGGGVLGLLVLQRGRLDRVARALRPALDVALDVDGYLREHPRDRTPRARIAERCVSLLRYLCGWRDAGGKPYAAIVLVAHSQGTVIVADTLRFIQRQRDGSPQPLYRQGTAAEAIPLYLFTMGSPLRQLYREFFPHLYRWVDEAEGSAGTAPPAIPSDAQPDPLELHVARWVNAYRSGDYIGRNLWRQSGSAVPFAREYRAEDEQATRVDLCIGAGAHTHYWDALAVAKELDTLIAIAARASGVVAPHG